jgi:FkbM family methyltransferase
MSVFLSSLLRHPYDEPGWRFVQRFLRQGMTVFDIGANQGFYTILAARRVGAAGQVHAFEPAGPERTKLSTNVRLNRHRNVRIVPMALGRGEGRVPFHLCLDHQGSYSSLRPPAHDVVAHTVVVDVRMTTLDGYVQQQGVETLDFVKLDVEGAEIDVLEGSAHALAALRPVIMCELADIRTRQWGYPAARIYYLLQQRGYGWFKPTRSGRLDPAPVKARYDPEWENLVAVPSERIRDVVTST